MSPLFLEIKMDDMKRFKDAELLALIEKYRNRLEEIEKESAGIRQKLVGLLNEAMSRNIRNAIDD